MPVEPDVVGHDPKVVDWRLDDVYLGGLGVILRVEILIRDSKLESLSVVYICAYF